MPDDILIIANPTSGGGRGKTMAEHVLDYVHGRGKTVGLVFTGKRGDAAELAARAAEKGISRIAACGGDGTIHEIVGAIANSDLEMGLLPCGRGNDFARAMNIPTKWDHAAEILVTGITRRIDLGRVNDRYFCTIATMGFDSEVARLVYNKAVPLTGTAGYVYGVIKTLIGYKGITAKLAGDFGTIEQSILLTATGNTRSYGGGMNIVPEAVPDDGLLDVCCVRMMSPFQILRLLPKVFWGGHTADPRVTISRTKWLTIETPEPVWLFADGEPVCRTPAEIRVAEKALTVLCPE